MPVHIAPVNPGAVLTDFAQIYGCSPEDFASSLAQIEGAWRATAEDGSLLGILGWRSTPVHGAEIMGGVLEGAERGEVAPTLLRALLQDHPEAYADEAYWPTSALERAGLKLYRTYAHSSGKLPDLQAPVPGGFNIVPLAEVSDLN